jgi:zinc finger SWIM domain-containing protein 3
MFKYEDREEFEQKFDLLRQNMIKQTWLDSIYKLKEKWAECYMKDVFTLEMRNTQLSESLNSDLKNILNLILISSGFLSILKGWWKEKGITN